MLHEATFCGFSVGMAKFQIRIDPSIQSALAKSAKDNLRSMVKEANRILGEYFAKVRSTK